MHWYSPSVGIAIHASSTGLAACVNVRVPMSPTALPRTPVCGDVHPHPRLQTRDAIFSQRSSLLSSVSAAFAIV
eukprot:336312-Lingulodinium_polyedra.AAC.1